MLSPKTLTLLLIVSVTALSYQTYTLIGLNQKLQEAGVSLGASAMSVDFTDNGSTPDMVGGC